MSAKDPLDRLAETAGAKLTVRPTYVGEDHVEFRTSNGRRLVLDAAGIHELPEARS